MDCEAKRILQISLGKLTDDSLDNMLSSTELAYCAYRTDYELDVDIDGVKNELLGRGCGPKCY